MRSSIKLTKEILERQANTIILDYDYLVDPNYEE